MTQYLDLALDYLKEHKLVAAIVGFFFIILLIRNFWFLVKLLVVLALGAVAVFLFLSFVGDAAKTKKDLIAPDESSRLAPITLYVASRQSPDTLSRLAPWPSGPFERPG